MTTPNSSSAPHANQNPGIASHLRSPEAGPVAEVGAPQGRAPGIRSAAKPHAVSTRQWFHDAQRLDRKLDDLVSKLDALVYQLDCCLGMVDPDDALQKLATEAKNCLDRTQAFKRSFTSIRGAINGAITVAEKMRNGPQKRNLLSAVNAAQTAYNDYLAQSTPPTLVNLQKRRRPASARHDG